MSCLLVKQAQVITAGVLGHSKPQSLSLPHLTASFHACQMCLQPCLLHQAHDCGKTELTISIRLAGVRLCYQAEGIRCSAMRMERALITTQSLSVHLMRHAAGKTLNITQQLTSSLPAEMVPVFLTFSARTSANQTQDIIDSKMDKRRKVGLAPITLCSHASWRICLNADCR